MENNLLTADRKLQAENIVINVKFMRENSYKNDVQYFAYVKGVEQTLATIFELTFRNYVLERLEDEGLLSSTN